MNKNQNTMKNEKSTLIKVLEWYQIIFEINKLNKKIKMVLLS